MGIALPTGRPAIRLKNKKKTDEAQYAFLASLVSSVGMFVEVFRSFYDGGFISFKCHSAFPAGSVFVAWRGGLVLLVSPRVAHK